MMKLVLNGRSQYLSLAEPMGSLFWDMKRLTGMMMRCVVPVFLSWLVVFSPLPKEQIGENRQLITMPPEPPPRWDGWLLWKYSNGPLLPIERPKCVAIDEMIMHNRNTTVIEVVPVANDSFDVTTL